VPISDLETGLCLRLTMLKPEAVRMIGPPRDIRCYACPDP
jgi:hypothetical protein